MASLDKMLLFALPLAAGSIRQQLINAVDVAVVGIVIAFFVVWKRLGIGRNVEKSGNSPEYQ